MSDELQTPAQGDDQRLRELEEWRRTADHRFSIGDRQFTRIRKQLAETGEELQRNTEVTSEIREIVLMGKAFFSGMQRIAKAFAWCWRWLYKLIRLAGIVAGAGAAIWGFIYMLTHKGAPPPGK